MSKIGGSQCQCCPTVCLVCKVSAIVDVGFFNAVSCQSLKIRASGYLAMLPILGDSNKLWVTGVGPSCGGVTALRFIITPTHPSTH